MGFPLAGPEDDISELLSRDLLQQHSGGKQYTRAQRSNLNNSLNKFEYDEDPLNSIIDQMWDGNLPGGLLRN